MRITDPEDPYYVSMTDSDRPIAKEFYDTWGNMELAQYAANGDGEDAAEARRRLSDRDGYGLIFMAGNAWRAWEGHVTTIIQDLRRDNDNLRRARGRDNVAAVGDIAAALADDLKRLLTDEPTSEPTTEPPAEPTAEPPPWLVRWD